VTEAIEEARCAWKRGQPPGAVVSARDGDRAGDAPAAEGV